MKDEDQVKHNVGVKSKQKLPPILISLSGPLFTYTKTFQNSSTEPCCHNGASDLPGTIVIGDRGGGSAVDQTFLSKGDLNFVLHQ